MTGASRGIGVAIGARLAADGARVTVNLHRSPDEAAAVVSAIRAAGGEATAVQADVSDPDQIEALFDAAERTFGRVSLLVNNAADRGTPTPGAEVDAAAVERMFGTNVRGPVLCIATFARRIGHGGGRVVNITSGQARTPMPGAGLYAGTKGAMEEITRAFAADLGQLASPSTALPPARRRPTRSRGRCPETSRNRPSPRQRSAASARPTTPRTWSRYCSPTTPGR